MWGMRPVILTEAVDAQTIASTPGIYAAESTSPAYGVLVGLAVAGEVRELGDVQTADAHHMIAVEVGPKRNAAGSITIGAEFFAGAKADYSSWEEKWWREAIQNAVDAGASEVHCKVEYLDDNEQPVTSYLDRKLVRVSCGDDGRGMNEEILLNKFLVLGRSGKGAEPGSVGGFGKAKELLLLPWVSWSVASKVAGDRQGVVVQGHGIQYDVSQVDVPGKHGTLITVIMKADDATSAPSAIGFIEKCYLPKVKFIVNDRKIKAAMKAGDLVRTIGNDANVYYDKNDKGRGGYPVMLVRVNGMYMHERHVSSGVKGTIIIELLGRSTELLTSNRDGIGPWGLRKAVDEFVNILAADTMTALRKKKGIIRERFEGTGKFAFKPEVVQRDILVSMGNLEPDKDGKLSFEQMRDLVRVLMGSDALGGDSDEGVDLRPSRDAIAAMMEVSFTGPVQVRALAKQAAWQPDFFIYNEVEGWKVPSKFKPDKMAPALRKLARFWAELCRFVLIQLNSEGEYGVGWAFEEGIAARAAVIENENWLILNPFVLGQMSGLNGGFGTGAIWSLSDPKHINHLYAIAVHECTHMANGVSLHDEAFASAFTMNVALTANRGKQIEKIRKAITARAAAPVKKPTDTDVLADEIRSWDEPEKSEHVGIGDDAAEGLWVYLAGPGQVSMIGAEYTVPVEGSAGRIQRLDSPHGSVRYRYLSNVGDCVGVLQVMTRDGETATIANVYVMPKWRRLGVAEALIKQARRDFLKVEHAAEEHLSPAGRAWKTKVNPAREFLDDGDAGKWTTWSSAGADAAGRDVRERFGARSAFGSWSCNELSSDERAAFSVFADAIEEENDELANNILKEVDLGSELALKRHIADMKLYPGSYLTRSEGQFSRDATDEFETAYLASIMRFVEQVMPSRNPTPNGRSVLTGPGWDKARAKLAGAAQATKKNPTGLVWAAPGADPALVDELEVARDAFHDNDDERGEAMLNAMVARDPELRIARCVRNVPIDRSYRSSMTRSSIRKARRVVEVAVDDGEPSVEYRGERIDIIDDDRNGWTYQVYSGNSYPSSEWTSLDAALDDIDARYGYRGPASSAAHRGSPQLKGRRETGSIEQSIYKIYGRGIQGKRLMFGEPDDVAGPEHHLVIVSASKKMVPKGEVAIYPWDESSGTDFGWPLRSEFETYFSHREALAECGIQYVIACDKVRGRVNPPRERKPCLAPHAELRADPELWDRCEFVGIQEGVNEGDEAMELRDCTCGSTLSKKITKEAMPPKDNPAWVTTLLAKHFETLEEKVPAKWLPKLTKTTAKRGKITAAMKEYGCGAYGCVLPTLDPKVVLKITTDDTEAEFANKLAGDLAAQVTVEYHLIAGLPERHKGRNTYLLWRDSAERVGEIDKVVAERGGSAADTEDAVDVQHKAAQAVYSALHEGRDARALIESWKTAAKSMGKRVPELRELADGMIVNLSKNNVFMGDVHAGNVGLVGDRWLIIDPGNVAVLQ
jgi:GNAT superfamily N-acetyltransferase